MGKKTVAALEHVKTAATRDLLDTKPVDIHDYMQPSADRKALNPKDLQAKRMREIQIPENFFKAFVNLAWAQNNDKEYMGWILGQEHVLPRSKKTALFVEGIYIPKQSGDFYTVAEMDNDSSGLVSHLEKSGTKVIGWVHSHPTFDAFLSSVDQHVQHQLQSEFPKSIAVVFDQHKWARVLRLTEAGMKTVEDCSEDATVSHPHSLPLEELFTDVEYFTVLSGQRSRLLVVNENDDGGILIFYEFICFLIPPCRLVFGTYGVFLCASSSICFVVCLEAIA